MPKSQFDSSLTVRAGRIGVTGVVDPDTNARAKESGANVEVHWVIAQGDLVAHGHVHADGKTFTDQDDNAQLWKDGPAQAPPCPGRLQTRSAFPAQRSRAQVQAAL